MTELTEALREHALSDDGVSPFNADGKLVGRAADHIELLESALRNIQKAAAGYIHPERKLSAEELIDVVLKEADSVRVNKALEDGDRDV